MKIPIPRDIEDVFDRPGSEWTSKQKEKVIRWLFREDVFNNLLRVAFRYLGRYAILDDAQDACSAFFGEKLDGVIAAYYNPAKSEPIPFFPYLRICLKNFCKTKRKEIERTCRPLVSMTLEQNEEGELVQLELDIKDDFHPEAANELRETYEVILDCTNELPSKHRKILQMSLCETGPEIAKELNVSQEDVRTTLHRARHHIRECLRRKGIEL